MSERAHRAHRPQTTTSVASSRRGTGAAWDCRARPYDPFGQLAFESLLPVTVQPEHRDAVAQLLVRTNWPLLTGAFQLDTETGELVFRTMLFLPGNAELPEALCRGLVYSNVLTQDGPASEWRPEARSC